MNIIELILLLIGTAAEIAKKRLSGETAEYTSVAEGAVKLLQVSLAIHIEVTGQTMSEVLSQLKPYQPILPPK